MWAKLNAYEVLMYIKKENGPAVVTLPDGSSMSRADLPADDTIRWVASRKAAVVRGVLAGLIEVEEVLTRYDLSAEEYDSWQMAAVEHGFGALKTTRLKKYRQL